jgi:hypothetical protein
MKDYCATDDAVGAPIVKETSKACMKWKLSTT